MKYLYRILKILIWGIYVFVLMPLTWLFVNIVMLLWYLDFKHWIYPTKEEIESWKKWESGDYISEKDENGEWKSYWHEYYYANPKQLFFNQRNYTTKEKQPWP